MSSSLWATEAAMVADFTAWAARQGWVVYAETCSWDLVLVRPEDGFQIGVEAKLSLNAKVLCQVLEHDGYWKPGEGPDCRAVLAPREKTPNGLAMIARRLGIVFIEGSGPQEYAFPRHTGPRFIPELPDIKGPWSALRDEFERGAWPEIHPDRRLKLPDYIPDVVGGHPSPVTLTQWKIGALKVMVILEIQGHITRADFTAMKMDSRRWTQFWLGKEEPPADAENRFQLMRADPRWFETKGCPDFRGQHPTNYQQIKDDRAKWLPPALAHLVEKA